MYCILLLSILIMIVTGFFSYMIEILNMAKQIKKDKYQRWWVLFFFNLGNYGYQIEMCDKFINSLCHLKLTLIWAEF